MPEPIASPRSPDPIETGAQSAEAPPRELTARALAFGCLFGSVLALGNTYLGLKTGFWDAAGVTTVLLSFAFFRAFSGAGRGTPGAYSVLENNVTQTAATAAASMPATIGFLGAVPALEMLGRRLTTVELLLFGAALAALGILLAVPLRERLIVERKLAFPAGSTIAEVTRTLHAAGGDTERRTRTLAGAGLFTVLWAWLRDGRPSLIRSELWLPGTIAGVPCQSLNLGVSLSPMLLAVGMLIGPLLATSMLLGAILAWVLVAPALLRSGVVPSADYGELVKWLLWPGAALMVASAFTSLLQSWRVWARGLRAAGGLGGGATRTGPATLAAAVVVGLLAWWIFGVPPLLVVVFVPLSVVMTAVVAQASGETYIAPLSAAGQITQLFGGLAAPLAGPAGALTAVADVAGGAIAAGIPAQTAQDLDSFKAGHILGSSPRRLLVAMFAGAAAGCLVAVPAYAVVTAAFKVGSTQLPAPFAVSWKAIAEIVAGGSTALPPFAGGAAALAFVVGVLLSWLQTHPRHGRLALSPIAIGIGFIVPAALPATMFLGALLLIALRRRRPAFAEHHVAPLAAGAITGESLTGVAVSVLRVAGLLG